VAQAASPPARDRVGEQLKDAWGRQLGFSNLASPDTPTHPTSTINTTMPSAMPQILISGALVWASAEVKELEESYQVLVLDSPDRATFIKELTNGKYSNISAIYRHNSSAGAVGFYDAEIIDALPPSLKYLCHNGAGELYPRHLSPDLVLILSGLQDTTRSTSPPAPRRVSTHLLPSLRLSLTYLSFPGIKVSNTPSAVDDATATVGMYLIISALRQFYKAEITARAGSSLSFAPHDLQADFTPHYRKVGPGNRSCS
jgi:hypothetical protein